MQAAVTVFRASVVTNQSLALLTSYDGFVLRRCSVIPFVIQPISAIMVPGKPMSDLDGSFTYTIFLAEERPRERLKKHGLKRSPVPNCWPWSSAPRCTGKSALIIAHELLKRFRNIKGVSEATLKSCL